MALRRALTAALALLPAAAAAQEAPAVVITAPRQPTKPSVAGPLVDDADAAPAQITVVPRAALEEPGTHRASDALYRDASVGENYPALGYYENFSIRGFTLDQGSAYRINGFVVPGELHIALDNKERIEILKGIGLVSGAASPGGVVNYLTRRPEDAAAARLELSELGGRYVGLDAGRARRAGAGLRVSIAHEEIRPYPSHADGERSFAALALDAAPARDLLVAADLELQRRSQFAVPGFQLLGGTALPPNEPRININQQPWSRPVENDGVFAGARAEYALGAGSKLHVGASLARAKIDDNLAFPFGCNGAPVQYFCADGSYVIYDYHAREVRETKHVEAIVVGRLDAGATRHRVALGVERIARSVSQRDYYSTTILDASGNGQTGNLSDPSAPLPAPVGMPVDRPTTHADQLAFFAADRIAWHAWELHAALRRVRVSQRPAGDEGAHWLPQAALVRNFGARTLAYAALASGVEFGSEAPASAENAGQLLAPRRTRSAELGWKQAAEKASVSAALFRMQRPYEFTAASGDSFAGLGAYQRAGTQVHDGIEASAAGSPAGSLTVSASAALISARARDTGDPSLDGVQLQNVPKLRSVLYARYAFAPAADVSLGWIHSASRNARRDGLASVPAYDRLDAGASWAVLSSAWRAKVTLKVTNLTDRRYWRDASEAYSADLLFPGAPREVWLGLSLQDRI